jgi:methionine-R-sulfoxide reductase
MLSWRFTRPIQAEIVIDQRDSSHGTIRIEVRCSSGGSHLGHVFAEGPAEAGGLCYCMNSASLRFIPVDQLKDEAMSDLVPAAIWIIGVPFGCGVAWRLPSHECW